MAATKAQIENAKNHYLTGVRRKTVEVEATCKSESCDADTALVDKWNSGGTRSVVCVGCGAGYRVPKDGDGPYQQG